jgi:hypothetical protein
MLDMQTDGGGLALLPQDSAAPGGLGQYYDQPNTTQLGPAGPQNVFNESGAQMIRNAPDPGAGDANATAASPSNQAPTPLASAQTPTMSAPVVTPTPTPAQPTFMQRIQNVAGLPTTPMTWQQRIQALARPDGRDRAQTTAATPSSWTPSLRPATSPQQPHTLTQQFPQSAQGFGLIGAGAPRPGQSFLPRPGGGFGGGMQPGGIGGAGPIPAPGSASPAYGPSA